MEDLAKAFQFPTEDENHGKERTKSKKKEKERRPKRENIIGRIWGTSRLQKPPRPDGDPPCYLNQDLNTDLSELYFFKGLKKEERNELLKFVYNGGVNVIANVQSNMLKYTLREKDPMEKEIPWDKYMASAIN
uniref:Uncharacterized protein n=1 Tax=Cacopsylla melanoneura TaxID=428564 RepID=A0A8D9C0V2_9HEMI